MSNEETLADKKCTPCEGGVSPYSHEEAQKMLSNLAGSWSINAKGHLYCKYNFKDFSEALRCTNIFGFIAEEEGHHPNLVLSFGKLEVEIWTHKINGLSINDFILAAKFEHEYNAEFVE